MLEHPDWVRRMNLFAPAVGGAEHIVPIDADDLLTLARQITGLHEIGDDDWLEGYRVCVKSITTDVELHLVGRVVTRAEILRVLETRLRLVEYWRLHPEVFDEPIDAPLFILGPPRTGTTILFELLAQDPNRRAPISWETNHPLPLPIEVPRHVLAESEQEFWADVHPEFMAMHQLAVDLPAECIHFWAMDFRGPYWGMMYERPSFDVWAAGKDFGPELYSFHRKFLQTLQHLRGPEGRRPWLLKSPGHSGTLPALLGEYPDARFIHTHRDPTKFAASVANLMCTLRFMRSDAVDPRVMGPGTAFGFRFLLELAIDLRAAGVVPDDHIADIHFLDLMADPVAAIRATYDHLGLPFDERMPDLITTYLRDKPKGKFGAHRYDPADLSLTDEGIRADYARYVDHYGITAE